MNPSSAGALRPALLDRQEGENDQDRVIVELLPLVKRIALKIRKSLPAHVDLDDLVGAGTLGLLDAVRKFDAGKKVRIETYAQHRIRGAMLDSLRRLDSASRDMRKKSKEVEKAQRDLEAKLGQSVGDAEVASELGISLEEWHHTLRELRAVGFHGLRPMFPEGSKPPVEELLVAGSEDDPFLRCYRQEQREILKRALAGLPKRERLIISLYYDRPQTMKQIAAKLGVDQSRVSQLHSAALVRLRKRVDTLLRRPQPRAQASRLPSPARPNSEIPLGPSLIFSPENLVSPA